MSLHLLQANTEQNQHLGREELKKKTKPNQTKTTTKTKKEIKRGIGEACLIPLSKP